MTSRPNDGGLPSAFPGGKLEGSQKVDEQSEPWGSGSLIRLQPAFLGQPGAPGPKGRGLFAGSHSCTGVHNYHLSPFFLPPILPVVS